MNPKQDNASIVDQFPDHIQVQEFDDSLTQILYAYRGTSMSPTFIEPDALEVHPYGKSEPRVGDVVVCMPDGHVEYVVHRISRITTQGISTRGDNSQVDDPWILSPKDIEGRVVSVWKGKKRRKMRGGRFGSFLLLFTRLLLIIVHSLSKFVKPFYHQASNNGVIYRLLPHQLRPRIIRFNRQGVITLRLIWLDRVIGSFHTESGTWQIKPPYLLIVNPELWKQSHLH